MNLVFISVKTVGIIIAVLLFSIFGLMNAKILDYFFLENIEKEKDTTFYQNIKNILMLTIFVSVLCFIGRNIIERFPFMFENVQGFEFKRLKEIKGGSLLLFFSIIFSSSYHKTIKNIKNIKSNE
tara:strand:+ start:1179 stop:1553 length:375 start_codon:yes stop_codon:yes gene_type:complete